MREIDRLADERYGLTTMLLMESAGLAVARVARRLLRPPLAERAVVILAGPGNNGGDGLVAARRLLAWGVDVTVYTSYDLGVAHDIARQQVELATSAGVTVDPWQPTDEELDPDSTAEVEEDEAAADAADLATYDLVIDALLGYGATGDPRPPVDEMIAAANQSGAPILAVDSPSGLDALTGAPADDCVQATATATLALPKAGLVVPGARRWVGRLFVCDIGLPPTLLAEAGVGVEDLFAEDDIVELPEPELTG
ncbi:MAG: NAD(P)H-hydrate epimerase [Chloroflexota bacterium]|nr:NAD(P)H-hydrate epimerase [Chloroflexota bacterium]